MNKIQIWQAIPFILPVISYIIGKSKNKLQIPQQVRDLLGNGDVIDIIAQGIEAAASMQGKSDDEKREYVRSWAKSELHNLLDEWLSDSSVNFLIEHAIIKSKG